MQDTNNVTKESAKSWAQQLDTVIASATTVKSEMQKGEEEVEAKLNQLDTNFSTMQGEVKSLKTKQSTIDTKVGNMSTAMVQHFVKVDSSMNSLQDSQGAIY